MREILEVLHGYISEKLYWSALVVGEYFYNKESSIEILCVIVEAMFGLEFYERCVEVVEANSEAQEYYEIYTIYLRSVGKCSYIRDGRKLKIELDPEKIRLKTIDRSHGILINVGSIIKLHKSACTSNTKRYLVDSFLLDVYNFEALFLLNKDYLISKDGLRDLLQQTGKTCVSECYFSTLLDDGYLLDKAFSPTAFMKTARELYVLRDDVELLSLGVYMMSFYKGSEYSYCILGMYYLLKNNYEESKKCFYKSLKINDSFGIGWIGLGISYSGLKECINALECFTNSQQQMAGSNVPSMYLGFEYHKMNNMDQAELWYRKSLVMEKNSAIVQKYSAFLILSEKYSEALELLSYSNSCLEDRYLRNGHSLNLLKCFCNLFMGNIQDAQACLHDNNDWRYLVTSGFIKHVQNRCEDAAHYYHQALIRTKQNSVIEDLLSHAVDIMTENEKNTVFNYATDLFESLDLKTTCINII